MAKPAMKQINLARKPTATVGNTAVPPEQKTSGLSVTVLSEPVVGAYKENQVLTEDRHIADYLTLVYWSFDPDDMSKLDNVSTDQVIAVLKEVDIDGMDAGQVAQAYVDAIARAPFDGGKDGLQRSPTFSAADLVAGDPLAIAVAAGARLDAMSIATLNMGFKGSQDFNACPIEMKEHLVRQFGHIGKDMNPIDGATQGEVHPRSLLHSFPPMNTSYTGADSDRAPYGYVPPSKRGAKGEDGKELPVYNGPYHHYKDDKRNPPKVNVVSYFVSQIPGLGTELVTLRNQLDTLVKEGAHPQPGTPADLIALKGDINKLNGIRRDVGRKFDILVKLVTKALYLFQRIEAFNEHFQTKDGALSIGYAREDATPSERARATLPFRIVTTTYKIGKDGVRERDNAYTKHLAIGTILGIEPKKWPANTKAATLLEPKQRGTRKEEAKQAGSQLPEINTSDRLADYLLPVANYIDDGQHFNNILERIRENKDGGLLASTLMRVHSDLTNLVTNKDLVKRANEFERASKEDK